MTQYVSLLTDVGLEHYLAVAAILFALGIYIVLTRRNAISILLGVELILNSAGLNYVAFSHFSTGNVDGQIYTVFIIMLAASEAAIPPPEVKSPTQKETTKNQLPSG